MKLKKRQKREKKETCSFMLIAIYNGEQYEEAGLTMGLEVEED